MPRDRGRRFSRDKHAGSPLPTGEGPKLCQGLPKKTCRRPSWVRPLKHAAKQRACQTCSGLLQPASTTYPSPAELHAPAPRPSRAGLRLPTFTDRQEAQASAGWGCRKPGLLASTGAGATARSPCQKQAWDERWQTGQRDARLFLSLWRGAAGSSSQQHG